MNADLHQTLLEIPKFGIGFFLGLVLNSVVGFFREKAGYKRMLAAIAAEGRANHVILEGSFLKYFNKGLVLREFSMDTVSQYLPTSMFVKHAPLSIVEDLHTYIRNLKLANAYRQRAEQIRLAGKDNPWLDNLINKWAENLEDCRASINRVTL